MNSTIFILSALICAACAVSLKSNEETLMHDIIPMGLRNNTGDTSKEELYITITQPMTWTAGRAYCQRLYPTKRNHVVLDSRGEIIAVSHKLQENGIREVWTDGRSDPTGTFYIWYSKGDGKPIDLPEEHIDLPCPGDDVFFNGLKLRGEVISGVPLNTSLPFICEWPSPPTTLSEQSLS